MENDRLQEIACRSELYPHRPGLSFQCSGVMHSLTPSPVYLFVYVHTQAHLGVRVEVRGQFARPW